MAFKKSMAGPLNEKKIKIHFSGHEKYFSMPTISRSVKKKQVGAFKKILLKTPRLDP